MQYDSFDQKHGQLRSKDGLHASGRSIRHVPEALRKAAIFMAACLISLVACQYIIVIPGFMKSSTEAVLEESKHHAFSWQNVVPSEQMVYHKCYDGFECARLEVPMDWYRKDGKGSKVAVAIIRLPARVNITDPRYGGAILTNPGGPGGSGVSQVLSNGRATQIIVDSDLSPDATDYLDFPTKYHDIIGFDPRGISRTTPGIQCWPDSLSREAWGMQNEALGLLGSSEDSFLRNWYRSKALAEGCSTAVGPSSDSSSSDDAIGEFVNSSPVARDMLEIVERHAEWIEKQGKLAQAAKDSISGYDDAQPIVQRTRWAKGEERIKYWGNSYGTILGQTFAAMFPDRVSRMVLDGVCDSHDYYFGNWFSNLDDADKIMDKFFDYCYDAGPEDCSFYSAAAAANNGPEFIKQAYEDLLKDIFQHPRPVPSSATRGPDVITWSDVKSTVRLGMYLPLIFMPMVADLLTDVSTGNGSLFADFKRMEHTPSCPSAECMAAGPFSQECNNDGKDDDNEEDASMAILCTDCEGLGDVDESQFQQYWHALQNQSAVLGDWWAHTRLSCVGWKTRARWRFQGPFAGNTSHPMLFIGTTLDPVTPFDNARRMAANFPGSALLQQDSEGHTSWSSPSICTGKIARAYFQTGLLPEPGTVCEVKRLPFQQRQSDVAALSETDRELVNALQVMQETFLKPKMGTRALTL